MGTDLISYTPLNNFDVVNLDFGGEVFKHGVTSVGVNSLAKRLYIFQRDLRCHGAYMSRAPITPHWRRYLPIHINP